MEPMQQYPIGIQTFEKLREEGYLYIDKTEYVYRMVHKGSSYKFLSRPRRFGKSLLTSTLRAYFEGRKELFEGLAIEQMEKEWTAYPVLHFDMSLGKHMDREQLENYLHFQLQGQEAKFGVSTTLRDTNTRLANLIATVCRQTGRQVVVLIDEYDAPLLDVVHEEQDLPILRDVMRNFYSPLKGSDPYLRFVFLTGITKFSQLSIFSELNNMENISMDESYAAICGITDEEMRTQMGPGLDWLSEKMGLTREALLAKLKDNYDGYHFTWPSPDIYNPFSLLTAFVKGKMGAYWFGTGTPAYLIEMLKRFQVLPSEIGARDVPPEDFDAPTESLTDIVPLLYQSGYLTIKDYDDFSDLYHLDIPNREIRIGLYRSLLPNYVRGTKMTGNTMVAKMSAAIRLQRMDEALQLLQSFLSTIPYAGQPMREAHYQQLFFIVFSLLGYQMDVEVRTSRGRVDVVMRTDTTLYVVELKLDKDAQAAMDQIDLKQYPERFVLCGLPVVKVGINFDSEKRTLGDWKIE